MNGSAAAIVTALVITPIFNAINNHRKKWVTYFRTGEYNIDRDKKTPDWAEMLNKSTGKWFLIKITRYDHPWSTGGGGVQFWTRDQDGDHRNYHRLGPWEANKESRRGVSREQVKAIKANGWDWPIVMPSIDPVAEQFRNAATSFNSMAASIQKLTRAVKDTGNTSDLQMTLVTENVVKAIKPVVLNLIAESRQPCKCVGTAGLKVPGAIKAPAALDEEE